MRPGIPVPPPEHPDWGFDAEDFWSLGGRLVPCGPAHMMTAVDLKQRLLWWSHDDQCWGFVPGTEYERCFAEIDAWRAIAPDAVDALTKFLASGKDDPEGMVHFARLMMIQSTFLRIQGFSCPWAGGWFYRSLLLDHRWLLRGFTLPEFDEYVFTIMIADALRGRARKEAIYWLKRDPVIAAMPALYDMIYPESWKTSIILDLREQRIFSTVADVDLAIERLAANGRLPIGQAALLPSVNNPLPSPAWSATIREVTAEVVLARLGASKVGSGGDYTPFALPTLDRVLEVDIRPR